MANQQQIAVKSDQSKHSIWRQRMMEWKKSGQSQARFCRSNGLNTNTFQYWKRKFDRKLEHHPLLSVSILCDEKPKVDGLHSGITLNLKGRFFLQFQDDFSASTLSKLVDILEKR